MAELRDEEGVVIWAEDAAVTELLPDLFMSAKGV